MFKWMAGFSFVALAVVVIICGFMPKFMSLGLLCFSLFLGAAVFKTLVPMLASVCALLCVALGLALIFKVIIHLPLCVSGLILFGFASAIILL